MVTGGKHSFATTFSTGRVRAFSLEKTQEIRIPMHGVRNANRFASRTVVRAVSGMRRVSL